MYIVMFVTSLSYFFLAIKDSQERKPFTKKKVRKKVPMKVERNSYPSSLTF